MKCLGNFTSDLRVPFFVEEDEKEQWASEQTQTLKNLSSFLQSDAATSTRHLAFSLVVFANVTGKLEDTLPHELDSTCTLLYKGLLGLVEDENAFKSKTSQDIAHEVWQLANLHVGEENKWNSEGHHDDEPRAAKQLASHVAAVLMCRHWALEKQKLTLEFLSELHTVLLYGSNVDYAGQWRTTPVHVGWHMFPTVKHTGQMEELVKEQIIEPFEARMKGDSCDAVIAASHLLHDVCKVHPFKNGNGRAARLLFAFALMRAGYPFPVIFTSGRSKARKHYGEALKRADNSNFHLLHATGLHSLTASWRNFEQNMQMEKSLED